MTDPNPYGRPVGDRHNFGKSVLNVTKPKPGFWKFRSPIIETLFLSPDGLLVRSGSTPGFSGLDFEQPTPEGSEYFVSELATHSSRFEISPTTIQSAGSLSAFAVIWGLGDLHAENVLPSESMGTQVPIDIECVLFDMISLEETLLVKGSRTSEIQAGLSRLQIGNDRDRTISFLNAFSVHFEAQKAFFLKNVEQLASAIANIPIRVLLRPTQAYRNFLGQQTVQEPTDFIEEEYLQLSRGDIPYFFVLRNAPGRVFYYSDPDGTFSQIESSAFKLVAERATQPLSTLTEEGRLNRLFATSVLRFVQHFGRLLFSQTTVLSLDNSRITLKPSEVLFECQYGSFRGQFSQP